MECKDIKRMIRKMLSCILAAVLAITLAHPVQAKDDPFQMAPSNRTEVFTTDKQLIYQIGYGDYKVISAVSSNPKAVPVRITAGGINVVMEPKRPGKATITIKAKKGNKIYKKKCKVTFLKYVNPFKELKIGGKRHTSKLNKKSEINFTQAYLNGKVSYKLKKGYTVTGFSANKYKGLSIYSSEVQSGDTLPKNTQWIGINLKNKQGIRFTIWITTKTYRDKMKDMGW